MGAKEKKGERAGEFRETIHSALEPALGGLIGTKRSRVFSSVGKNGKKRRRNESRAGEQIEVKYN